MMSSAFFGVCTVLGDRGFGRVGNEIETMLNCPGSWERRRDVLRMKMT
jgi:hypothetical protein